MLWSRGVLHLLNCSGLSGEEAQAALPGGAAFPAVFFCGNGALWHCLSTAGAAAGDNGIQEVAASSLQDPSWWEVLGKLLTIVFAVAGARGIP